MRPHSPLPPSRSNSAGRQATPPRAARRLDDSAAAGVYARSPGANRRSYAAEPLIAVDASMEAPPPPAVFGRTNFAVRSPPRMQSPPRGILKQQSGYGGEGGYQQYGADTVEER